MDMERDLELGRCASFNKIENRETYPFWTLTKEQRLRHIYVIGKTGTGKSTALLNWAVKDIRKGRGCIFIDPHGHSAETLLSLIPEHRRGAVVYFAPHEFPTAFNILDGVPKDKRSFVASSMVDTFKGVFGLDFTASNIEMFVKMTILALLETPGTTLLGLTYFLTSPTYRRKIVRNITNPIVKDFWEQFFDEHMTDRDQRERTISTISKNLQLITEPAIAHCIGQETSDLDFRGIMDTGKIFIASLPEGALTRPITSIFMSFLISRINVAAGERQSDTLVPVFIENSSSRHPWSCASPLPPGANRVSG
jgi:hypothetical protein